MKVFKDFRAKAQRNKWSFPTKYLSFRGTMKVPVWVVLDEIHRPFLLVIWEARAKKFEKLLTYRGVSCSSL